MKVLISPISVAEAFEVCDGGADIVDVKNVDEGSLGANFPWVIRSVVDALKDRPVTFSATLGDLPFKPGTAALAALGAAHAGARYIKAGLYGTRTYEEACAVMRAVVRACADYDPSITTVAAGYADYRKFQGLDPMTLVRVAADTGCDVVMVDTAIKDGSTLFDNMDFAELEGFVSAGHANDMQVALAGSVKRAHLPAIIEAGTDIVGIRGAVCAGSDRRAPIVAELVRSFMDSVRTPIQT